MISVIKQQNSLEISVSRDLSIKSSVDNLPENFNGEFSIDFLVNFLSDLVEFNKTSDECDELEIKIASHINNMDANHINNIEQLTEQYKEYVREAINNKAIIFKNYETSLEELNQQETIKQNEIFNRINKCKKSIGDIVTKKLISVKPVQGNIKALNINEQSEYKKALNNEIERLRVSLFAEEKTIQQIRNNLYNDYLLVCSRINKNEQEERTKYINAVKAAKDNHYFTRTELLNRSKVLIFDKIKKAINN
jgi:hypothetical protein